MTIVCRQCGVEHTGSDAFCGACGAYLEWEGTPVPPPQRVPPVPPNPVGPGPPYAQPGFPQPAPAQGPHTPPGFPPPVPPSAYPPPQGVPAQRGNYPPPVPPVTVPPNGPGSPPNPLGQNVPVRQPGDVAKRRRVEQPPDPAPADSYCSRCGAGNLASQTFCRGCGAKLAVQPAPRRLPWWRRMFARRHPVIQAGHRLRRRRRRFRASYLVLASLLAGGIALAGPFRGYVDDSMDYLRDLITRPVPADATAKASSERKGHGARRLVDGTRDSYWAPSAGAPARGEYVVFTFEEPVDLVLLIISSGTSSQEPEFRAQARPREVELSWETDTGDGAPLRHELIDSADAQNVEVSAAQITELRMTIVSSYGVRKGRHVAIGEVEFRVKR